MKDEPAPITKAGLLAAIDTAINLLPRYAHSSWKMRGHDLWDCSHLEEYLRTLRKNILYDRCKR